MRVPIEKCDVHACAYNQHDHCHAVNVTIGKERAKCELFTRSVMFVVNPRFHSQVSSCRMSSCASNRLSGCTQAKVTIGPCADGGMCGEYVDRIQDK